MWVYDFLSLILVGALWGCTNPMMRLASTNKAEDPTSPSSGPSQPLDKLQSIRVWIPFVLNQMGSLVFYATLRQSDLSIAVPAANALSLVFSLVTSYGLGERLNRPVVAIMGSTLVMVGVAVCVDARR